MSISLKFYNISLAQLTSIEKSSIKTIKVQRTGDSMRCSTGTAHLRLGPSLRRRGVLTEPVCLPHQGPSVLFCSVPRQSNRVSWLCSMNIVKCK